MHDRSGSVDIVDKALQLLTATASKYVSWAARQKKHSEWINE